MHIAQDDVFKHRPIGSGEKTTAASGQRDIAELNVSTHAKRTIGSAMMLNVDVQSALQGISVAVVPVKPLTITFSIRPGSHISIWKARNA